jgi:hypothetical protein
VASADSARDSRRSAFRHLYGRSLYRGIIATTKRLAELTIVKFHEFMSAKMP